MNPNDKLLVNASPFVVPTCQQREEKSWFHFIMRWSVKIDYYHKKQISRVSFTLSS